VTTSLDPSSPLALRRQLRARRRAIGPQERREAALRLAVFADAARLLRPNRRIALYLALPEEIDTTPLLDRARRRGCRIHLPRITDTRANRMVFVDARSPWRRGRWGIREPVSSARIPTRHLQVVFMPLVGFDEQGNRLGMGKGFYDRALAFRRHHPFTRRPLLVGLAFECQAVDALPARAHDVPLDLLITERGIHRFKERDTDHACVTGY
jgi:5-formyltetrahydrofolate cyclo-ligase